MAIQSFPRPVHPKVKKQTDDQIAKVGQLNQLVRDINQLQTDPSSPTGIPFMWYPPAGLTSAGPKFTYTDGVELISYHIKGIYSINVPNSPGFISYLCTINFPDGEPFIMPGSLTGMFQVSYNGKIITTPLSDGARVNLDGQPSSITDFQISLENYENNPQPDGSYNYALVTEAFTGGSPITGLMAYDFEFLLPNSETPPTIFQD